MKLEERTFGTPPYLLMRFIDIQLNKICVNFYALLCAYLLDNVISSEVPGSGILYFADWTGLDWTGLVKRGLVKRGLKICKTRTQNL